MGRIEVDNLAIFRCERIYKIHLTSIFAILKLLIPSGKDRLTGFFQYLSHLLKPNRFLLRCDISNNDRSK